MTFSLIQHRLCAAGGLLALLPALSASSSAWDPLYVPAQLSPLAAHTQLLAVERVGDALVAAGWRGHIVLANEVNPVWIQAQVPVSTDLTALSFPTRARGWAVGHAGVVLKTTDGGHTWERQLDGRAAGTLMAEYYRVRADAGDQAAARALADIELNTAEGPEELPWLDVDFRDESHGLLVGSFNMILETADGGQSWTPLLERVDNPEALHLNAVSTIAGEVYLASERGVVFKRDANGDFQRLDTGYEGTWFGVTGNPSVLLAYGLRGTLYRSEDRGLHWCPVDSGVTAALTGAAVLDNGEMVLVSQGGDVLRVSADGRSVTVLKRAMGARLAGVVAARSQVVVVGTRGVQTVAF